MGQVSSRNKDLHRMFYQIIKKYFYQILSPASKIEVFRNFEFAKHLKLKINMVLFEKLIGYAEN